MGLTILASVAGTLVLVGVAALFLLRGDGKKPGDEEPSATSTGKAVATNSAVASASAAPPVPPPTAPPTTTTDSPPTAPTAPPTTPPPPTQTAPPPPPTQTTAPPPKPDKTDKGPKEVPPVDKGGGGGGSGFLTVVCKPACDSVVVKGRNLGPSPVINVSFPAGTYPVSLKRSGSAPKSTSVTIVAGKNTPLRVNM